MPLLFTAGSAGLQPTGWYDGGKEKLCKGGKQSSSTGWVEKNLFLVVGLKPREQLIETPCTLRRGWRLTFREAAPHHASKARRKFSRYLIPREGGEGDFRQSTWRPW